MECNKCDEHLQAAMNAQMKFVDDVKKGREAGLGGIGISPLSKAAYEWHKNKKEEVEERHASYKTILKGSRFAGMSIFLRDMAFGMGLELQIEVEKGFIQETVRFKVEGIESKVREFVADLDASLKAHNKE